MIKKRGKEEKKEEEKKRQGRFSSPKAFTYHRNHATTIATPKLQPHMLPVNILKVGKGNVHQLFLLMFVSIWIYLAHTSPYFPCL